MPAQFKTPALPYAYDALEPYIDRETMMLHHDKHHVAYTAKFNAALGDDGVLLQKQPEDILRKLDSIPADIRTAVRNNGGGHVNHALFWEILSPDGGKPAGKLKEALVRDFGSVDTFMQRFEEAATALFGSGWAWLTIDNGKLSVEQTSNQDTPLSAGRTPLLALDVWEHAYYLKYKNVRADYVKAFWNVVNWDAVSERYRNANKL
ncbi:MAG: superoxide dismutase [Patescibacteria group bacterium]